jgi:hypothetical protein
MSGDILQDKRFRHEFHGFPRTKDAEDFPRTQNAEDFPRTKGAEDKKALGRKGKMLRFTNYDFRFTLPSFPVQIP